MTESKPDGLLGREIARRYRIEAKIGEGGMGSVYRARNVATGKVVAIKVLQEDLAAYDSFVQRFLHEARATAYLNHPHAINIIDCGRDSDLVYLLMEYVEGRTLSQVMKDEGPFSAQRAARILNQVCAAVAEAHGQSIIHRDLKPDNIMLQQVAGEADYVKVLDFGIAKVLDEQKRGEAPVSRNIFIGTPEYASPEQCNTKSPTALSDIYSLGVILYEMLAGAPPFTGDPMEVMQKHVHTGPPPLRSARPDLSESIEQTVSRALSKNPTDRQQHVMQLAEEFDEAVQALGPAAESPPPSRTTGRPSVKSYRALIQAAPTEIATSEMASMRLRRSLQRLIQRRRTIGLVGLAVIMLVGVAYGYRFYGWYHQWPPLPSAPALKTPAPPAALTDTHAAAQQLFERGNREGAVQELLNLLSQYGSLSPDARTLLGVVYADQGDYENAVGQFETAIEQSDGAAPAARTHLGQLLAELGRVDEALQTLAAAESKDNPFLPALVALGKAHLERNGPQIAERYFTSVIRQAKDSPEDLLQVGKVLLLKEQLDLAVRELRRAIAAKQESYPEAELYLGIALFRQGDLNASAEALNQAITHRQGNYPAARLALGMTLYQQKSHRPAVDELRAAIRLRGGNYPQAEFILGLALADLAVGQFEEAKQQLQQAIAHRGGRFPEAERAMGLVHFFRLGLPQEARRIWTQANDPTSKEWLQRTEGAMIFSAASGSSTQRAMGLAPMQEGHTITFEFVPMPGTDRQPTIAFRTGEFGWGVQPATAPAGRWNWVAFKLSGDQRQPLEPHLFGDALTEITPTQVSIQIDQLKAVWTVNGKEIGRADVQPPVQLFARINDGRVIVFNVRHTAR
jgi:serine/threonine protein kinase/lipopolysaccharide biosynthesis regulator YciM